MECEGVGTGVGTEKMICENENTKGVSKKCSQSDDFCLKMTCLSDNNVDLLTLKGCLADIPITNETMFFNICLKDVRQITISRIAFFDTQL